MSERTNGRRPSERTTVRNRGAERGRGQERTRRASHSMEAVLNEAVKLLDEDGASALTFRALAARLGGGVASIYWYVSSKDELLDRATDHVLDSVLADFEKLESSSDPIDDIRVMAIKLFDAIVDRPWVAAYFMRAADVQSNELRLYERIGQEVLRLGLTSRQSFHAVSAVIGFVLGIATDLGQEPPQEFREGNIDQAAFIARFADQWRTLDESEYPFLHHIVDDFAVHDDTEQFRAGLDLLLAGLRLQAGR